MLQVQQRKLITMQIFEVKPGYSRILVGCKGSIGSGADRHRDLHTLRASIPRNVVNAFERSGQSGSRIQIVGRFLRSFKF